MLAFPFLCLGVSIQVRQFLGIFRTEAKFVEEITHAMGEEILLALADEQCEPVTLQDCRLKFLQLGYVQVRELVLLRESGSKSYGKGAVKAYRINHL